MYIRAGEVAQAVGWFGKGNSAHNCLAQGKVVTDDTLALYPGATWRNMPADKSHIQHAWKALLGY